MSQCHVSHSELIECSQDAKRIANSVSSLQANKGGDFALSKNFLYLFNSYIVTEKATCTVCVCVCAIVSQ